MRAIKIVAAVSVLATACVAAAQEAAERPAAPPVNAEVLMADALARAKKEEKSVFLTSHASW